MPELAFFYGLGFVISILFFLYQLWSFHQRHTSEKTKSLQANLKKINLAWSDSTATLIDYSETVIADESKKFNQALYFFGVFCIFLSWLGFFFQVIIFYSIQKLAVSRFERALYKSRLVSEPLLLASEVQVIVDGLRTS